jgi:hypothetical protein
MELTEEQRKLVTSVLDDMYGDDGVFDKDTEKWEEFKEMVLQDDDPGEIESLMDLCQKYVEEKKKGGATFADFAFIMLYDMWINKSSVWPVRFNPEWKKKDK